MPRAPRPPRSSPRNAARTSSGRQPESISARENHWLKRFRIALAGPPSSGEITLGIEGVRLVEEALRSNIRVEAVLVSESGRKHLARIIPRIGRETRLLATTDALFQNLAATETTQGVAAIVWPRRAEFTDLFGGNRFVKRTGESQQCYVDRRAGRTAGSGQRRHHPAHRGSPGSDRGSGVSLPTPSAPLTFFLPKWFAHLPERCFACPLRKEFQRRFCKRKCARRESACWPPRLRKITTQLRRGMQI